ncbi:MAG: ABC transporter ATP-binding protein [Candidatus Omnitrophica bacterium]|nr:ABC transporter ATP-binding protein [Candidatus Omnitrophota bacterium]
MQSNEIILECKELKKSFQVRKRNIPVLNGLNLRIKRGEIVAISGKSGAGKSTLIGLLGGLERPTSGAIVFENKHLDELSNEELALLRRKKIGIIFQNFNLLPSWTALENVQASLMHRGLSEREQRRRVEPLLKQLGLPARYNSLPAELSMGEQQRVAVARALVNEPDLILADEPTGDVDSENAKDITSHLVSAVRKNGATMILATHADTLLDICDRVLNLKNGSLS